MPRNISLENSLLALCSPACLGFYLALLALCFSSEKLKVFLFTLQLNAESERQNVILLVVHLSFRMERAPATVATIILNDTCGVHREIFQLKFTWKAGNDAEGKKSTIVPPWNLCSFPHQLSLFFCSMLMSVKTQKVLTYIEFLCVIAREKYIEVNVCLGKYIFA